MNTCFRLDRDRETIYNGDAVILTSFKCSSCEEEYIFLAICHSHCPMCGLKYDDGDRAIKESIETLEKNGFKISKIEV